MEMGKEYSYWDVVELSALERLQTFFETSESTRDRYYPSDYNLWRRPLEAALYILAGEKDPRTELKPLFRAYFQELASPNETWQYLTTFTGIRSESSFKLDDRFLVKPLTEWHKRPHVADRRVALDLLDMPNEHDQLALIGTLTAPKQPGGPYLDHEFFDAEIAFLSALRLIKSGDIQSHCFASGQISGYPFKETVGWAHRHISPDKHGDALITKRDVRALKHLWASLMRKQAWPSPFSSRSKLTEALNRLWRTYESQAWVDDIVDLTIAIEALVSPSDKEELSHRVALRASHVLGSQGEASPETYKTVRLMYGIRSATVHGSAPPPEQKMAKWLEQLSGQKYDLEKGLWPLYAAATDPPRDLVKRLILGCLRINGKTDMPRYPLPKDFDLLMLTRRNRVTWQRVFQANTWTFELPS